MDRIQTVSTVLAHTSGKIEMQEKKKIYAIIVPDRTSENGLQNAHIFFFGSLLLWVLSPASWDFLVIFKEGFSSEKQNV